MNYKRFFEVVRNGPFRRLNVEQVKGCERILSDLTQKGWADTWIAYVLATTFHETGKRMQPINEIGSDKYFFKMYDIQAPTERRRRVAKMLGNTVPGDGVKFHGRGPVQLTGRSNYQKASNHFGVDFTKNPELALDDKYAWDIMYWGMENGVYTGRRLGNYLNGARKDYEGARAIVNGSDCDKKIARYAQQFENAIVQAKSLPADQPGTHAKPKPGVPPVGKGIAATILAFVAGLVAIITGWLEGLWNNVVTFLDSIF